MSEKYNPISQAALADMWNDMIPPPDGQIVINRLGTVCMSYKTFQQCGYKIDNEKVTEWEKEWEER